ncbi:MAG: hypothetical protein TYPL_4460 [Candidatus Tyloplasma litorale]|nr:MAG: hypothetical protein TYPL_4460 [Mycoplasmatales bacterium]
MISKKIHIIWFGDMPINWKYESKIWEKYNDYEIKIWDESSFDFQKNDFVKRAYKLKKWSFLTDYFRMEILYKEGGIYLDTDMDPFEKLDEKLLENELFLGYEYKNNLSMGIIASVPNHIFLKEVLKYYDSIDKCCFFPLGNIVWTEIFFRMYPYFSKKSKTQTINSITILNRNLVSLWNERRVKSYFVHKHEINWIDSIFVVKFIQFISRFSILTPSWIENFITFWNRINTKNIKKQNIKKIYIQNKIGSFLNKELFNFISNENKNNDLVIYLFEKDQNLSYTLKQIYNVKKIRIINNSLFKPDFILDNTHNKIRISIGAHSMQMNLHYYVVRGRRDKLETFHNKIYRSFFIYGCNGVLVK